MLYKLISMLIVVVVGFMVFYLKYKNNKTGNKLPRKTNQNVNQAQSSNNKIPDNIKIRAKDEVKNKYQSIDQQVMDEPAPTLNNNLWTFTIVDISARIPTSGYTIFLISADANTGEILSITPNKY